MKRKTLFIFLVITGLSLFVRFGNFEKLVNFHGDPPFYLHEVKDMLDAGKIRLTGPIVMSKMIQGRGFFSGPFHYYVLTLLGLAFNWNVLWLTAFFTLLWIAFFVLTFVWFRKKFGEAIALVVYAFISFLPVFMSLSRTMWNPHFVPLFGLMFLWALDKRRERAIYYFLAGLFFGLGLNVHYSTVLWIPIILWVIGKEVRERKSLFKNWFLFFGGAFLAELPLVLFELRHNFYNLRTLIFQLKFGELSRGYTFALPYYFLYPGIPVFAYLLGVWLKSLRNRKLFAPLMAFLVLAVILFLKLDLGAYGQKPAYPRGWSLSRQKAVVDLIIADNEKEFEVAETINSDTRAQEIRWWLREKGIQVMGIADYDKAEVLYLVAPKARPPQNETVWEVSALRPFKVEFKKDLGEGLYLYKLVKTGELQAATCDERYFTLVNPVRGRQLWADKSTAPLTNQYHLIKENGFPATWLLQYDALKDRELTAEIKKFAANQELGLFLEVSEELARAARVTYPPNFDWANPRVIFLSGYERAERRRLIDRLFKEFKAEFGYFPTAVGAWWIDSYSLDYMKQKYNIKSALIVADQQTTDRYGVWGQWWGVAYYPSKKNILVPANEDSKQEIVILQWAQRHPDLAYGEGPAFSNYSLQANDYTSLGQDTNFFSDLVDIYSDCANPVSQVTVGLETGMESSAFLAEYQNQLALLKKKTNLKAVTMSDYAQKFGEVYPDFPKKLEIKGETTWEMTPDFRKNEKLGDFVAYNSKMAFADYSGADESEFLNRRLPELKETNVSWPKQFETPLLGRLRASYLNNKYYLGIALDAFRFVGFSYEAPFKIDFVNQDFLNLKYFLRII